MLRATLSLSWLSLAFGETFTLPALPYECLGLRYTSPTFAGKVPILLLQIPHALLESARVLSTHAIVFQILWFAVLPSGKLAQHNYGQYQCLMGKSTINYHFQ